MNMRRAVISAFAFTVALCCASPLCAQELQCNVEINAQQVEGGSKAVFETLRNSIAEYMNTTKFTSANFSSQEKIDCRLYFTITDYTDGVMKGDLQIQSTRPVYNSSYTTPLFNFKDSEIEFGYTENDPLTYSESVMESNLTAILNFYAYLIIALDFDSFSPRGGNEYYDRLATIVQLARSSGETGWSAFSDPKSRSSILSALTDGATATYRDLLYTYHRRGLDEMSVSPDKGRATILGSLPALAKIYSSAPMSVVLSMFHDAKLDEIADICTNAQQEERNRTYELLRDIYPTDIEPLNKIKNQSVK